MKYQVYKVGNNEEIISTFQSSWQFRETEIIFVQTLLEGKRVFSVSHITHDIDTSGEHVVRIYCQEKRNHHR